MSILEPRLEGGRLRSGQHQLNRNPHRTIPPVVELNDRLRTQNAACGPQPCGYSVVDFYRTVESGSCIGDLLCELAWSSTAFVRSTTENIQGCKPEAIVQAGIVQVEWLRIIRSPPPRRKLPPFGIDLGSHVRQPCLIGSQARREDIQPWIDPRDRPHRHAHGTVYRILTARDVEPGGHFGERNVKIERVPGSSIDPDHFFRKLYIRNTPGHSREEYAFPFGRNQKIRNRKRGEHTGPVQCLVR